jgi:hypothetical protein
MNKSMEISHTYALVHSYIQQTFGFFYELKDIKDLAD